MRLTLLIRAALPLVLLLVLSSAAYAQLFESVGIRAQGMAGAFVAVADDSTASWWNPAGLASGAYFSAVVEYGSTRQPRNDHDASGVPVAARQTDVRSFASAYPALGVSYYRLTISEMRPDPATGGADPGRLDLRAREVFLRSLVLNQFGATIGQSVGQHLIVGSTLKLLRGAVNAQTVDITSTDANLAHARTLGGDTQTRGDLDVGAMLSLGSARLGVSWKNVTQPTFGSGASAIELKRAGRVGMAFGTNAKKGKASLMLAVDADLTTNATYVGDERHVAAGVEAWNANHRLGFRAGASANTVGSSRPVGSVGLSLGVTSGTFLEGQATAGRDDMLRGWGVGLRVTY